MRTLKMDEDDVQARTVDLDLANSKHLTSHQSPEESEQSSHTKEDQVQEFDFDVASMNQEQIDAIKYSSVLTGKQLVVCVFANLCCLFLVALDQTITMTILSTIANKFSSFSEITWITTGFVLPLGCLSQVWGQLSIIFGRKASMLTSVVIFEIGSIICAVANSMNMLIGGRAIQGVGGCGIMTCAFMICAEIVTDDKRPMLLSLNGSVFAVATVLGPIVGGVLTKVSWRWCFWINVCFGALVIPLFTLSFKSDWTGGKGWENLKSKLKQIDYLGIFLVVAALVLLLLGISLGTTYHWSYPACIGCFVCGVVLCFVFAWWNFTQSEHPILPLIIVKVPGLSMAAAVAFVSFGAFMPTLQFIALYFQIVCQQEALHSGVSMLTNIILTTTAAITIGHLIKVTTLIKPYFILAGLLMSLGIGIFQVLKVTSSPHLMIGLQSICGYGFGLMFQPPMLTAQILAPVPSSKEKTLDAKSSVMMSTAYVTFTRNVGSAFFSEIAQLIYTTTLRSSLRAIGERENLPMDMVTDLVSNVDALKTIKKEYGADIETKLRAGFLSSMQNVFWMAFACACLMTIMGFFMADVRVRAPTKKEDTEKAAASESESASETVNVDEEEEEEDM